MPRQRTQNSRYSFAPQLLSIFLTWSLLLPPSSAAAPLAFPAAPAPDPAPVPGNPVPQEPVFRRCPDAVPDQNWTPPARNRSADEWGDITIAQPKIWQFERVSALLDGLLRDVEGVSLADLTQLDPNAQNAAALKFIQSALEVGVQYDQAAAVNARNTLENYQELHASQLQQLQQYNNYMQTLTSERDRLAAQYSAATNEVNALNALKAAGPLTPAQTKQLEEAISRQTSTQTSLTSVNSLISGAGAAPALTAAPTVTGTSVQLPASGSTMSSSLMGFSEVLKNLPQGLQDNLNSALKSPSYPATKRLDNFITLLYERLAREISVLQDDLTHDPENVPFLLQFDVGLYPARKSKDHVARVEFNLDCPGCKVYSLYPSQSAYNLANYSGSSKRNTIWGNLLTLIGFGLSASYRREQDTLQGSLVQSVYISGFQDGVLNDELGRAPSGFPPAPQSFGWYYGAAPFEQLVTPGIRSTFALITVPRDLIATPPALDTWGNTNTCLPFHINGGWASRKDPLALHASGSPIGEVAKVAATPFYYVERKELQLNETNNTKGATTDQRAGSRQIVNKPLYETAVVTKKALVKLPVSLNDFSLVARREKQKLHVLRMEYNGASEPPDPSATASVVQTTVQSASQATNQATGQTTGQTATQTISTAVTASNLTGSNSAASTLTPATASPSLDLLPCPKGKCAAVVLKLDRPIDPNLIVTVNGEPLMRVRDWRGRATSVLPAAQSGTDLAGTLSAAGSPAFGQLQKSRSLLESDSYAPNTWFALNSHELLLNVSVNVATDEEFPVIQLADPSGSVLIPHDLRRNITELIVNGFRMRPQTEASIQREIARQNWPEGNQITPFPVLSRSGDAPIASGPYPFSTFLPLFYPEPAQRSVFALVGETGDDLLIGFLPRITDKSGAGKPIYNDWLEAHTQVILEDRDLDLAWSLSCDVQGDLLACRLPRQEISRAYLNYLRACPTEEACPAFDVRSLSLLNSLLETSMLRSRQQKTAVPTPDTVEPFGAAISDEQRIEARKQADTLLRTVSDLGQFRGAFVSSMEVWVGQSDPEGKQVFYSGEPARINLLPLSDNYWGGDAHFMPWHFTSADENNVYFEECNYLPGSSQSQVSISILGEPSWSGWLGLTDTPIGPTQNNNCGTFKVPTRILRKEKEELVFVMDFPTRVAKHPLRTTIAVPLDSLRPHFGRPQVLVPERSSQFAAQKWVVKFPVERAVYSDLNGLQAELHTLTSVTAAWEDGGVAIPIAAAEPPTFLGDQKNGRVNLVVTIDRQGLAQLPKELHLIRQAGGAGIVVATLTSLRHLLLPHRLTLDTLSSTQFALLGENAGVIDAVAMQNGTNSETLSVASGFGFSLVTLPADSSPKPDSSGNGTTSANDNSTKISITTNPNSSNRVEMSTQNKTTPQKPPAQPAQKGNQPAPAPTPAPADKPAALKPGTYAVLPLMLIGYKSPVQSEVDAKVKADPTVKKAEEDLKTAKNLKTGTDSSKTVTQKEKDAAVKKATDVLSKATKDAGDAAKKALTTPIYMPLEVTDPKGKPLVFTVPEPPKKPDTSTNPGTSACAVPCAVLPCTTATCPPATTKPAATP